MATGDIITNKGMNVILNRAYTPNASLSSTQYLPPTVFKVGINNSTPNVADTNLFSSIPIADGTVCDNGAHTYTGATAGSNSTANTSIFKEGAGTSDYTAQNLIKADTNVLATWTITNLASAGVNADATKYIGFWFYIKDATALAKFLIAGTALELRIGVDSTTNYYSKTYTAASLSVGWNWLSNNQILSTWTVVGTPGTLSHFMILITTNNATDTFTAATAISADIVVDMLRQWTVSEFTQTYISGYPTFDYTNNEVTIRAYLSSLQANGFNLNGLGLFNTDTSPIMTDETTILANSKSSTDEFAFIVKNRIL